MPTCRPYTTGRLSGFSTVSLLVAGTVVACSRTGLWIDELRPTNIGMAGADVGSAGSTPQSGAQTATGGTIGVGGSTHRSSAPTASGGTIGSTHRSSAPTATGGTIGMGGSTHRGGTPGTGNGGAATWTSANTTVGGSGGACRRTSQTMAVEPTRVFVVVDASSSMSTRPSGSSRTSWDVTSSALTTTIDGSHDTGFHSATELGLLTYPNTVIDTALRLDPSPIDRCVNLDAAVTMATLGVLASPQRTKLVDALQTTVLEHGTPTYDAYRAGLGDLLGAPLPADWSRSYMVLITDGSPTISADCINPNTGTFRNVDAQPIVTQIADALTRRVRTFIVGLPGSQTSRNWLSAAAQSGGTPRDGCAAAGTGNYCHLDISTAPDFEAALRGALTTIVDQVSPCRFALGTPASISAPFASLTIDWHDGNSTRLGQIDKTDTACRDGFRILDDQRIELCTDSCLWAYHRPAATLQLESDCLAQ